ncbi:MAG TPA: RNA methyltransferase [Candidatus Paceibacterota bacterium]|nr:RNA methyltransferase [Candidatus Paceibacterota bacterium]
MKSIVPRRILILDNIRSAENVGSLFRTADAVGIETIFLCGITPSPIDRFGRPFGKISKTALGAEKTISWEKVSDTVACLKQLKKQGYQIITIEQSKKSHDYRKVRVRLPVAFVLGNEVDGVSKNILSLSDNIAEIPMSGRKESLNVAVAGGIALFRMLGK